MSNIKVYKTEVGIDRPYIPDDMFEIELPISDEEVNAIFSGALRLYWVKNSIDEWEYIEAFAPDAYKKAVALAEEYCVPKWGDKMKLANGAYYEFFLPDEVEKIIWESKEIKKENRIRKKQKDKSKKQFHEDARILNQANDNGLFLNKLKPDPIWNNLIFSGLWSSESKDLAASYSIHTLVDINGYTEEVEYQKRYKRDEVQFRVFIRSHIKSYFEDFISKKNDYYNKEEFEICFDENYNPPVIITKSKCPDYDIKFFIRFLEYLVSK